DYYCYSTHSSGYHRVF
nr:immunoglobulin light chain junction region [Macaca mulatta]MOV96665.1 immunoglobulin light chain junction region [Macaca mulatta]